MPEKKIVFLQIPEAHKESFLEILSSHLEFNNAGFEFVILPLEAKVMSKDDIRGFVGELALLVAAG
jgi:hypothetical protein